MTADSPNGGPVVAVSLGAAEASTPINENLQIEVVSGEPSIVCSHCQHVICAAEAIVEEHLAHFEGPPSLGGPMIWATPRAFVDADVVFRQSYCPGCFTAVSTRIVPTDHPQVRDRVHPLTGEAS